MGEIFAGRHELVDPLGEGGTGVVCRAWDHRGNRYVAADRLAGDHPGLADLLRTYGLATVEEAADHLRRHRDLF